MAMKIKINYENKKIQDVELGDYVVSFDIENNKFRHNVVTNTHLPIVKRENQVKLITTDGTWFITSKTHPMCFRNENGNWDYKPTENIIVGDIVKSQNGLETEILSIKIGNEIEEENDEQFFDISVNNDNNYLAGHNDKKVVVHNSSTTYFPFWHKEIEDVLVLKNNKGTDDNRVRKMDYGIQFCRLFYKRFIANETITLFSPHEVKDLYEAFGDNEKFEELYLKYEKDNKVSKKVIKARDLMNQFCQERIGTGRIYLQNIDHANEHSSFLEQISMSNLCVEITLPVNYMSHIDDGRTVKKWITVKSEDLEEYNEWRKDNQTLYLNGRTNKLHKLTNTNLFELFDSPNNIKDDTIFFEEEFELVWGETPAEIALCVLSAINLGAIKELSDLEEICEFTVRALDYVITHQDYPVEAAKKMLQRRSIGVGVTNLAYYFAKNNVEYGSAESLLLLDETMEFIQYYLIKASVKLAKEYGKCGFFNKTKYSKGILPIDTYCKKVDGIVSRPYKLDWEGLRRDVLTYGMRNSTLTAIMPCESSSVVSNSTNGIEPPRNLITIKKSKQGVIKMAVPEVYKLKNKYKMAFDVTNKEYSNIQAVIQKWIDQGISGNHYYSMENGESLSMTEVVKDIIYFYNMGGKQLYYANTSDGKTDDINKMMNEKSNTVKSEVVDDEDGEDCVGGACSI